MDLLKALLDAISPPDKKSFIINNLQNEGGIQPYPDYAEQKFGIKSDIPTPRVNWQTRSDWKDKLANAGGMAALIAGAVAQPELTAATIALSPGEKSIAEGIDPKTHEYYGTPLQGITWSPSKDYPKFVKPSRWVSKTFQTKLAKAMINELPNIPPEKVPETASKIKTFIDWMGKASDKKLVAKQLFEDLDPATRKLVFDTMEKVSPYSGVVKGGRETFWQELKARNAKNPPERINELRKNFLEAKEKKYRLSPDEQEELLKLGGLGSSSVAPLQPSVPTTGDDLADILLRSLKNLKK